MDELERLRQENKYLKEQICQLEKALTVITVLNRSPLYTDINRSMEISRYLEQQQSVLAVAQLINAVTDKSKLDIEQRQGKNMQLLSEKAKLDARISKDVDEILKISAIKKAILQERVGRMLSITYEQLVYGFLNAMNAVYEQQTWM